MPVSFPSSPTNGQTYTYGNKTWSWNGTTWTAVGTAYVSNATSPATYDAVSQTIGVNTSLLAGKGNAVLNSDFSKWSRGTSFNGANAYYTADNWSHLSDKLNSSLVTSQQTFTPGTAPVAGYEGTYYLRNVVPSGGTYQIVQQMMDLRTFAGKTVTLSYWAKADANVSNSPSLVQYFGSVAAGATVENATYASSVTITTSWQRFTHTVTLPNLAGKTIVSGSSPTLNPTFFLRVIRTIDALAHTVDLWGVQLEVGSSATTYAPAGGNTALDTAAAGSAGFDGVLVSTNSATNQSNSGTPAWAGYDVAGKNKVINGAFDFWQRGTSVSLTNSGAYTIDRYYTGTAASGTFAITQQAFTAGQTDVPNAGPYFAQIAVSTVAGGELTNRIEDVRTLAGQLATFSFYARTTSGTAGIIAEYVHSFGTGGSSAYSTNSVAFTLTTTWQRFSFTSTIPSIVGKTIGVGSYLGARITGMQIGTFQIANIQVEAGSVATPFSRAGGTIQGELAACQRYYWRVVGTANQPVGWANAWSAGSAYALIQYPVTMRTAPSMEYSSLVVQNYGTGSTAVTAASGDVVSPFMAGLVVTSSGMTANKSYGLTPSTTSAYIGFSAEL